jgi:hypothetical protein
MRKASSQPLPSIRVRRKAIRTLKALLIRLRGTSWHITAELNGSPSLGNLCLRQSPDRPSVS